MREQIVRVLFLERIGRGAGPHVARPPPRQSEKISPEKLRVLARRLPRFFYTKTARRPTTVIVRTLAIVQLVRAELNCLRKPRTSARQTTRTRVCKPRKLYVCVRPSRLSRRGIFLTPRKRPSFGGETARPVLRARQLQVFSNAIFKRTRSPRAADAISSRC